MPELPEVETIRAGLQERLVGRTVRQVVFGRKDLRFPIPVQRFRRLVRDAKVNAVGRRSKYLLIETGEVVQLLHLGMSGRLRFCRADEPTRKHEHVCWRLDRDEDLRLEDPRRFGVLDIVTRDALAQHKLLKHLGVEPLSSALTVDYLVAKARRRTVELKSVLMDAKVVVGIGNIYASEIAYDARVSPVAAVPTLSIKQWQRIVQSTRRILQRAIQAGGTSLRDYVDVAGAAGGFGAQLRVYGRAGQPCVDCGETINREVHKGRSTYWCPGCQSGGAAKQQPSSRGGEQANKRF